MKRNQLCSNVFITILIAIFLTPFLSSIGQAESLKSEKTKHFVIGVEDLQYYPLWYYDEVQNEYTGLAREMLDAFADSAGYSFEYKSFPIKRLVRTLVRNEIDFKFPDNPYWAQDVKADTKITYSDAAIDYIDGVFVKPENIGKGDENIKVLGSVLGFTPWDWLGRIDEGKLILKEVPDVEALINQAIAGRIDGAYVNAAIVRYHLTTSGRAGALVFDEKLSHTKSQYLLSTTQHEEIIDEFNAWLENNKTQINAMKNKFGVQYKMDETSKNTNVVEGEVQHIDNSKIKENSEDTLSDSGNNNNSNMKGIAAE